MSEGLEVVEVEERRFEKERLQKRCLLRFERAGVVYRAARGYASFGRLVVKGAENSSRADTSPCSVFCTEIHTRHGFVVRRMVQLLLAPVRVRTESAAHKVHPAKNYSSAKTLWPPQTRSALRKENSAASQD